MGETFEEQHKTSPEGSRVSGQLQKASSPPPHSMSVHDSGHSSFDLLEKQLGDEPPDGWRPIPTPPHGPNEQKPPYPQRSITISKYPVKQPVPKSQPSIGVSEPNSPKKEVKFPSSKQVQFKKGNNLGGSVELSSE